MEDRELAKTDRMRAAVDDKGVLTVKVLYDTGDDHGGFVMLRPEDVSALREAFAKLNNNGNPEGTGFPGVPGAAVGDFCMAMLGIGLAAFGLLRGGAGLGLTPAQQKDPDVQANLRQLDSCTSTAEAALRGGSRLVIPR